MLNRVRRMAPALLRPEGAVLAVGLVVFAIWLVVRSVRPPVPAVELERYQGADRYATAAQLALAARPDGADTVILARGDDFADAVSAGALVGPTDGVVLLTQAQALPPPVREAIRELDPTTIYLLGGEAAITEAVEDELEPGHQIIRLAGDTRIGTAAEVAMELERFDAIGSIERRRTAFVVGADAFPDALAASSASAAGGFPILLTGPEELSPVTRQTLDRLDIDRVIVVGGTAVIGLPVSIALQEGGYLVEEISGPNRSATAASVADRFVRSTLALDGDTAILARGDEFADALAAGSYGGILGAPLLLATSPTDPGEATLRYLAQRQRDAELTRLVVVGGEQALTEQAVDAALAAAVGAAEADGGSRT